MSKRKRKRVFVDAKVQGALLWRSFLHWVVCVTTVGCVAVLIGIVMSPGRTNPNDIWYRITPTFVAALLLLPILLVDVLFMSNRFVGPLWRLRWGLRRLAAGEHVGPLGFRKHDFWGEVAEEFNAVAARVEQLQDAAAADAPPSEQVEVTG